MKSANDIEHDLRADLAAAFQISAYYDWHEGIANHFSAALPGDEGRFLMNPKWRHFSLIKASDLVLLRSGDDSVMTGSNPPDPTAWYLHGALHRQLPHAKCVMHLHPPFTTALSCLVDPELKPVDQTTARFFNRVAVDTDYGGMADNVAEGQRICDLLRERSVLLMGNHGVLILGNSIPEAFDTMYHFERAARTLVLAYGTGRDVKVLDDTVAERTARGWQKVGHSAFTHFDQVKQILDQRGSTFRD